MCELLVSPALTVRPSSALVFRIAGGTIACRQSGNLCWFIDYAMAKPVTITGVSLKQVVFTAWVNGCLCASASGAHCSSVRGSPSHMEHWGLREGDGAVHTVEVSF